MFILCNDIDCAYYDKTLLLSILSKFKLTSLEIDRGDRDEYMLMSLLQMTSIQETLEDVTIISLDIFKCTSVFELLAEFKRINVIRIGWSYDDCNDEVKEWKLKIKQFEEEMKKKNSEIYIDIDIDYKDYY